MSGLFKTPKVKAPPDPKVVRMPTEDPNQAKRRRQAAAAQRQGRRSTIMTDALKEMTGSSGQSLGG